MVQHGGSASRTLKTLPQRPPTPPRESDNADSRPSLFSRIFSKGRGFQTPPDISPRSSAESVGTPDRSHKKVGWSDHKEPLGAPEDSPRPLPPSSDRKPLKSILKPYNAAIPLNQASSIASASFAVMLESVTQQLAGEDRTSRLDAYMSLYGVLKATDGIPDPKALKDKLGLLTQFIRRDMTAQSEAGTPDTVLIINAILLLSGLLWRAETLPHEFCLFVIDHCIASFENPSVSKDVAKHLMFVLGQQNFSSRVMTQERTGRLLKACHEIEQHVTGKGIVLGRLGIHKKLLRQARTSMISNPVWVEDMFEDMLTSIKDVRSPVIVFALEAALQLGTEAKVSRAVMELFQSPHEKGRYADHFTGRLNSIIQAKQDVACVPQIWSVVILFLRARSSQLEQWEFLTSWLQILQKCFNNSDSEVKAQANYAWNRLVFAIRPDEKTRRMFIKMLDQPFLGQLKRKNVGKHAKESFQVTTGSICNLLYYTMKPGASFAQLDLYWDAYAAHLIGTLFDGHDDKQSPQKGGLARDGSNVAIAILKALLDPLRKPTAPWKLDRAMSTELMRPEELSPIDPKWIRKNHERVLDVLEPILSEQFADLAKAHSPAMGLWRAFLLSVAAAGAKEIKVSHETMACMAGIFTLLNKLWQKCPSPADPARGGEPSAFLDSWVCLVTESIAALGVPPFTEKKLSIGQRNTFAAVATPSTSDKAPKNVRSSIQYLMIFFVEPMDAIPCNDDYKDAICRTLGPFLKARASHSSKLEFCQDLVQYLPPPDAIPNRVATQTVWCVIADWLAALLNEKDDASTHVSSSGHSQPLGANYRELARVLEYGLISLSSKAVPGWQSLFHAALAFVGSEAGDGGRALSVIDPTGRSLHELYSPAEAPSFVRLCSTLVKCACYPVDAATLEAARRKLWGSSSGSKSSSADPYRNLYGTVDFYLEKSYEICNADAEEQHELLSAVTDFIRRCPDAIVCNLLETIGNGVAAWMRDSRGILERGSSLLRSTLTLGDVVCSKLVTMRINSNSLSRLQGLIAAALNSKHKAIVTSAVNLWNTMFGSRDNLEYPEEVGKALARLRPVADLKLPNFPSQYEEQLPIHQFIDSDEDEPVLSSSPRKRHAVPNPIITAQSLRSASKKRKLDEPQSTSKSKSTKSGTPPRLRHDDSQIQFAAIESSPAADHPMDSQLLTDRQREVKERQKAEGAMFPDLRSSPQPKTRRHDQRLSLSSDRPVSSSAEGDKPSTPPVHQTSPAFDDFIASSPTPRRESEEQSSGFNFDSDSDAAVIHSSPPRALLPESAHRSQSNEIQARSPEIRGRASPRRLSAEEAKVVFVDASSGVEDEGGGEGPAPEAPYVDAPSSPQPVPAQKLEARRQRRSSSSSFSDMDEDSMLRLIDRYDEVPAASLSAKQNTDANAETKHGSKAKGSQKDAHTNHTPAEGVKSRKRQRTSIKPTDAERQQEPAATAGSSRGNSRRSASAAARDTPMLETHSRSGSRVGRKSAEAASEAHIGEQLRVPEEGKQSSERPAKRRCVEDSDARVVIADSQDAQAAAAQQGSTVVAPREQPPKGNRRSKKAESGREPESTLSRRKTLRSRDRPRNKILRVEEEREIANSAPEAAHPQPSIDLDAAAHVQQDGSAEVKDEKGGADAPLDMDTAPAQRNDGHSTPRDPEGDDADAEAQIIESMSQAEASRPAAPPAPAAPSDAPARSTSPVRRTTEALDTTSGGEAHGSADRGAAAVARFQALIEGLQRTALSRAEVLRMEEMMWDFKAELYAAEKRGRFA